MKQICPVIQVTILRINKLSILNHRHNQDNCLSPYSFICKKY